MRAYRATFRGGVAVPDDYLGTKSFEEMTVDERLEKLREFDSLLFDDDEVLNPEDFPRLNFGRELNWSDEVTP